MKELHTALFVAPTGVGKTHLALSLLETEYRNHFDFIVIICPTLRYDSAYKNRSWVHVPIFGGLSGLEDRGGGDNSIQFINIGRVGDKSFKE